MNVDDFLKVAVILWALIDPVGTIPVFIAVAQKHSSNDVLKLALRAVIISWLVLLFFMVSGESILNTMEIPLPAFQVSGGIILFIFSLSMIFGQSKPEEELRMMSSIEDSAVFPLAMPSIASPGAIMGIVLLTEKRNSSLESQIMVGLTMTLILAITFFLLYSSKYIHRVIGNAGASLLSRMMGLLISAAAAKNVLDGIKTYFAF